MSLYFAACRALRYRTVAPLFAFFAIFASPSIVDARPRPPIAPRLSGFGTSTVAGSGRHLKPPRTRIYKVTSLSDRGRGTLRWCAEARGPRTCLFAVGGVIQLSRPIAITAPFITIAGQTAPPPGITLTNAGLTIATHDVLVQHLAIRPGDNTEGAKPSERDGISIGAKPPRSAHHVLVDHVSLTWAIDENISTAYPLTRDITIANSIIAEGLHDSIHPKGPHSKGIMVGDGSKNITIRDNLIAFNEERNPYIKPGTSVEFINNLVYGWGSKGGWSLCNVTNNEDREEPLILSFVGNVYRPAPSSIILPPIYAKRIDPHSQIFIHDTIAPTSNTPASISASHALPANLGVRTTAPLVSPFTKALPARETTDRVLTYAGSRPRRRDIHDARIVREVELSSGTLKDCTVGCPRPTGKLSLANRTSTPLRLPRHPFKDTNGDGYTNLENWLHSRAAALER
jgi:hypothetical protein